MLAQGPEPKSQSLTVLQRLSEEVLSENLLDNDEATGLRVLCGLAHDDRKIPWDCEDCEHPEKRARSPMSEAERRAESDRLKCVRGCIGKSRQPYDLYDGTRYWTCPRKFQKDLGLSEFMRLYLWYDDKGTLPVGGGLLDQPAKVVQAFEVIRSGFRQIQRIEQDERDRKMKRDKLKSKAKGRG